MKQKLKLKRFMGLMLMLAMVIGMMPEMSLTAYAATETYTIFLIYKAVVKFNKHDWYIIADDSTATGGTVTLLAADTSFGTSAFSNNNSNAYSSSTVKGVLDALTAEGGDFASVKDAIADTDLSDVGVNGAKLYLLSTSEAEPYKNFNFSGAAYGGGWWLRSRGRDIDKRAACVYGANNYVDGNPGSSVADTLGVRPALKLDLSSVIFSSESKTFSLKPAGYSVTLSGGANATTSGGATSQTGLTGAMTTVTYTVNTGYYFAEFADITDNGITAKRTSSTVVTVSGTPTADATIKVPDATVNVPDAVTNDEADDTQQNPDGTKTVTKENADGKTISVTNYSKTDEQISQFIFKKAKGTTVDLTNVSSKTLKTVVVPESVKANGNTYKVTRIRKGFLKNCKQATKVDIGKNINTIDKNAFNYGKKVQKVVIRGKLKKVGKYAFKKTKKNVVIKVKTNAKNFEKNKKLLEKSGLPTNATVKRVKNKK